MVCMSPSSTVDIVTKISKQYDSKVLNWASELKQVCNIMYDATKLLFVYLLQRLVLTHPSQSSLTTLESTDEDTDYSEGDISFISEGEQVGDHEGDSDNEMNAEEDIDIFELDAGHQEDVGMSVVEHDSTDIPDDIIRQLFDEIDNDLNIDVDPTLTLSNTAESAPVQSYGPVPGESVAATNAVATTNAVGATTAENYGYVLVIDNLDMNVRRSFQRIDRTTQSMHICHVYAALNRIDTSGLEDGYASRVLSPAVVLPNAQDLQNLISDFKVFISR